MVSRSLRLRFMDKSTKTCELVIHLNRGARITGKFHVPFRTGSTIRPSDAVREIKDGYLVLTEAVVHEPPEPRSLSAVMVPVATIAFIELPGSGWIAR